MIQSKRNQTGQLQGLVQLFIGVLSLNQLYSSKHNSILVKNESPLHNVCLSTFLASTSISLYRHIHIVNVLTLSPDKWYPYLSLSLLILCMPTQSKPQRINNSLCLQKTCFNFLLQLQFSGFTALLYNFTNTKNFCKVMIILLVYPHTKHHTYIWVQS